MTQPTWDWLVPPEEAAARAAAFVRDVIEGAGAAGVVVGLSGGIDSAVAAALAVRGLGPDRVLGVLLPYRTSSASSQTDARAVAERLGIAVEQREITAYADPLLADIPQDALVRRGNVMARCRMIVLYDLSARDGRLVLGTGNRTETLLGYATLHGDAAYGLNPLGYLYKAEVRALARHLELPEEVIVKPPTADLWAGQTDEQELGVSYDDADRILHYLVDEGLGVRQIVALGFPPEQVEGILARVRRQAFKWRPVPICEFPGRPLPDPATLGQE